MTEPDNINVVLNPPALYQFEFEPAPALGFELLPSPFFAVRMPASAPILVSLVTQQPLINISVGVIGVQGPPGPAGPRGSLFLGGYPTFANLPVPDGVNIKVGDFALVQDESAIYELE